MYALIITYVLYIYWLRQLGIKLLNLPTLQWDYWKYKYNNNKDKV